jgi:small-conductance mechanosensitive channel
MEQINILLQVDIASNTIGAYATSLLIFLGVYIALILFRKSVLKKLKGLAQKTKTDFDDFLIEIILSVGTPLYLLLSIGIALQFIEYPAGLKSIGYWIAFGVVVYSAVKALSRTIDYFFEKIIDKRKKEDSTIDLSAIKLLVKGSKGILWAIVILLVVQNLGYDITALIAGLGIGGVAIAFALQGILSDVFASFSIYFDKPFQTGDFIVIGNEMGTVKHIGLKSTRIQTLEGEELIMSNKELTEARIKNYRGFEKRRMTFSFGIKYETPTKKIRAISQMVKDIIGGIDKAEIQRIHFTDFGDFSLNFGVVYYITSGDFTVHKDVQHEINIELMECFEKEGIEFAYPTQTVYIQK